VGELTGYRDETTEQPDLGDCRHGRSDVIPIHIGGYRTIAADQPQSLSVMKTPRRRVPYRRLCAEWSDGRWAVAGDHICRFWA
jgi:hypothetical protein